MFPVWTLKSFVFDSIDAEDDKPFDVDKWKNFFFISLWEIVVLLHKIMKYTSQLSLFNRLVMKNETLKANSIIIGFVVSTDSYSI